MKKLLLALVAACQLGCAENPPYKENNDIRLPTCRFIYIGGCKYLWCSQHYRGGLDSVENCRPTSGDVSDKR